MSQLIIYRDNDPQTPIATHTEFKSIAAALAEIGVSFERWQASVDLPPQATQTEILAAYAKQIERLNRQGGYTNADVVRMTQNHPDRVMLRKKFLDEHTHAEDEVRFFVEGGGGFYLHTNQRVYQIICERGDLLRVPANARHWFDMGPEPLFTAIRIFTNPEGWVGHFTGNPIARLFPRYGETCATA